MRNFIPVRYGTVFLQNPGIPVFFGTVQTLYFHTGIFWKLFGIFRYFFIGAISDQFRKFSQLLELLYICKLPQKHFFFFTIKFQQLKILSKQVRVFFGDELGKCSWWKWMFDTLTAETSFSVFGFMKGKEVSWQLSTTKHFLLYFLTAAQCYDLHALQKVLTEMESEIRICKVYTWKTFKGSGRPQKSPKLSKNQYTYLKTLSCVLYKSTEKYRYFIFRNPGIGIWVKSRYTGIFRYTAGACSQHNQSQKIEALI